MTKRVCKMDGCYGPLKARGLCNKHYRRVLQKRADTCSIEGCQSPVKARGWCNKHWFRWDRYGDPLGGGIYRHIGPLKSRFWKNVQRSEGCWIWDGSLNESGYGIIGYQKETLRAHRVSWELHMGSIPEGMQIDHKCRNRQCVNPDHLRIATQKQNSENTTSRKGAISEYRGVTWNARRNKWVAQATHNGRLHFAGYFEVEEEANKAAIELRNEIFTYNYLDRLPA